MKTNILYALPASYCANFAVCRVNLAAWRATDGKLRMERMYALAVRRKRVGEWTYNGWTERTPSRK
ncbi:MAG: hypothetical protein LBG28_07475 [Tannerella sp.]|nr:hypothetical protein [Tannerella sp.]